MTAPVPPGTPPADAPPPRPVIAKPIDQLIAASGIPDLFVRVQQAFPDDYRGYLDVLERRRDEGASDAELGQEIQVRLVTIVRKHALEGSRAAYDKLQAAARNQIELFGELGNSYPAVCPAFFQAGAMAGLAQMPEKVRTLFRDSLVRRFEAIFDGVARTETPAAVSREDATELDGRLRRVGYSLEVLQNLAKETPEDPGKRCRAFQTVLLVAIDLEDAARKRVLPALLFPN